MTQESAITTVEVIEQRIFFVRCQRVMLDSDLARIYGVSTKRLNEQFRRNRNRFPEDFAFQLTRQELINLRPQIATSSLYGGRRYLPWVFTEHGAIMLASVLNSPTANEASVRVVRAFVHMREILAHNQELKAKFGELERRLDAHDDALKVLFDAIRQLLEPPASVTSRPEIGFHVKEEARKYGVSLEKS
jgi:hypothetical protein